MDDKKKKQRPHEDCKKLKEMWDIAQSKYATAFRRIRLLDAADRGKLWEALKGKFPKYQILADTNHVSYVKNNLMASIYTVAKAASLTPTTEEDTEIIENLNITLGHLWDVGKVPSFQLRAGERAALTNLGITQVGWDDTLSGGTGNNKFNGNVVYKNIDPTRFMRDPFSDSLDNAAYCITWDLLHKSVLKSNPLYVDKLKSYEAKDGQGSTSTTIDLITDGPAASEAQSQKNYYKLIIFWIRDGDKIHEVHTLDAEYILYSKEDIQPAMFPFALLYCNEPSGDLIGTSEPAKIFSNSMAYNIINSCLLTAEYRNQRPPKFLNTQSGLNIDSFIRHGNDADKTFIVQGDARNAVHYHEFPQPSQYAPTVMAMLNADMQQVTGVDGKYTGRDTGSILTTGGVEAMLDQATLIDTPKVHNYEEYTRTLTELTVGNLMEFGGKRKYFVKLPDGMAKTIEVPYEELKMDTIFSYALNISTELPKNKARLAQAANVLMEKQMQYQAGGIQVELITPEEWLRMQDFPQRELMQKRMNVQRTASYEKEVMEVLTTYTELVQMGSSPRDAVLNTAAALSANARGEQITPPQAVMESTANMAAQTPVPQQPQQPQQGVDMSPL